MPSAKSAIGGDTYGRKQDFEKGLQRELRRLRHEKRVRQHEERIERCQQEEPSGETPDPVGVEALFRVINHSRATDPMYGGKARPYRAIRCPCKGDCTNLDHLFDETESDLKYA